jgi:uncharacterized delta-60 repeat protein
MLDPTFGVAGRVTTRIAVPSEDTGNSTAIDSLGRIVVAGYTFDGSGYDFAVTRFTSAGAVDTTFGTNGAATIAFGGGNDTAYDVAVDSQNRVVVVGQTYSQSQYDMAVARLTVAGALDSSFDGDGMQTITFGTSNDQAFGVAIDSLNRIVVAGATYNGSDYDFAIARLTVAGALDSSFDGDGKQTIAFGTSEDSGFGVRIDSLGRIVVSGQTYIGSSSDFAIARLTTAGALDTSFDGDGKQTVSFGSTNDYGYGVTLDSLGRIVVDGFTSDGSQFNFAVARLTTTGALDTSFDGDGRQTIAFGLNIIQPIEVAVDSLNRVVVIDSTNNGSSFVFAIARLTSAGALDASFDGDGKQTVAFGTSDDEAAGVKVDSSDRVVVAGYARIGPSADLALARLTTAGALDTTFDGDGKQTLGLTQSLAHGRAVAVDGLGRTVVAGYLNNNVTDEFAVARYTPAGVLDSTFGGSGIVTFSFGMNYDSAFSVAIDSLNRIVVAGNTNNGNDDNFAVARLTAAGALDTSFDGDGRQTIDFGGNHDDAYGVAIDSQDRVVVAGSTYNGTEYDFAVARLTTAGALDSTFDGDGKQIVDFFLSDDIAYGVAVDSLDRVVLGGDTGPNYDFAVARLTTSGELDTSFNGGGEQTIDFGSSDEHAYGVAVDSLGRVVLGGSTDGGSDFAVARLTTSGALDNSFDGDGRQSIDFGSAFDTGNAVDIDSQNRIVVAGNTFNGSDYDFAIARLTTGGALDSSFDSDGKQTIAFGVRDDLAYGVAIDSANRVLVAGESDFDGRDFAVARLTGDTTTASAQVNDGSAQRSRVTSLTVRFSSQVTFSGSPDQAFTLTRNGDGAVSFTATVSVQNGGTVVLLDHFAGSNTEFGSLADGRYTLTALASQISVGGQALDGDADGTAGGDFVFNDTQGLFRFYGDVNGDQTVNGFDLGFFRNAFGTQTGDSNYLSYFDFNGDGVINGFDLGQFRTRFGTTLP